VALIGELRSKLEGRQSEPTEREHNAPTRERWEALDDNEVDDRGRRSVLARNSAQFRSQHRSRLTSWVAVEIPFMVEHAKLGRDASQGEVEADIRKR
jgi:hypothetical protein